MVVGSWLVGGVVDNWMYCACVEGGNVVGRVVGCVHVYMCRCMEMGCLRPRACSHMA